MPRILRFTLPALLLGSQVLCAQSYIFNYQVPVTEGGTEYVNPFAGGLNNPQFYHLDIDYDGDQDLYAFDRAGNVSMVFLREGLGFTYWHQYASLFPPMKDWVVLRNYNCDGFMDILTGDNTGIKTYLASWNGFTYSFAEDVTRMQFTEAGFTFDLPVGSIDIPGVADIDFDGDLDILTFNMTGGIVDHYINRQVENGEDPCGVWTLEHINSCWGNFYESGISLSVELDYDCKGISRMSDGVHAGSTFMIFDEDNDNDMDLVLGDLAFGVLNRLTNGGDKDYAEITDQDTTYPSYDVPYDHPNYPAAFLFDVDADGAEDMLVSPNSLTQSESRKNVWYYRNVASDGAYTFQFQTDSFLVSTMIDLGEGAYPVFFDHNYDGLMDIIAGNDGYYVEGETIGQLALFENTGTADAPAFTLVTRNYAGLADFGFQSIVPTFGDLDGDGDDDMLIGESEGFVHFFKNIGPPGGPANFILFGPNYQGIDPGQNSAPQLVDVSGDGLDDLIIGERNGNLNYYLNTGTAAAPIFTLQSEFWGNVDVRTLGALTGHSVPFLTQLGDDKTLFVGCEEGTIYHYTPTADFTGAFTEVTAAFSNIDAGAYSSACMSDINQDGLPELIIGNRRGGVQLFRDETANFITEQSTTPLQIFPNPADNILNIRAGALTGNEQVRVIDIQGREFPVQVTLQNGLMTCAIGELPPGLYIAQLWSNRDTLLGVGTFIRL